MCRSMKKPPWFAKWLTIQMSAYEDDFSFIGDLMEEFREIAVKRGSLRAKMWYWIQVLYSLPYYVILTLYWRIAMFKNYLKTAFRNIRRYKGYSFINIFGLAIGIASCMMIMLFVRSEISYDKFHENSDRIYRVTLTGNIGANQFSVADGPFPLAHALVTDYPEVVEAARIYRQGNVYVRHEDKQFREERFLWADSSIFDVFTISLIIGDQEKALKEPNSVIINPATAEKYFGNENPMGKILVFEDGTLYKVTAIAKELPQASHFHFDFLAAFSTLDASRDPNWIGNGVHTYIVLQAGFPWKKFDAKLPQVSENYVGPLIEQAMGITYDQFLAAGNCFGFSLQPLLDIHLHSDLGNELEPNGNFNTVIIFSAIAAVILFVACINFINLATARSAQRANEVGVRKVVGSNKKQLVNQFLAESIVLTAIAVIFALILVVLLLPIFNRLVGKDFSMSFLTDGVYLAGIICSIFIIGLIAGGYPAFMLASFQPVTVLKGKIQSGVKGRIFRNVLVVTQFVASIVLFIGTVVIYNQLYYLRNKELGFDKEQLVIVQNAQRIGSQQQSFKNELKQVAGVVNATFSNSLPQMSLNGQVFQKEGAEGNESHTLVNLAVDYDFLDTYRIEMVEGRFFTPDRSTDSLAVILNEAAVKALNLSNPMEERLIQVAGDGDRILHIIGIYKNFHLQSLHESIRPMISTLLHDEPGRYLSVRIQPGMIEETIQYIEEKWNQFVPDQPLEYVFLDERFDQMYRTEIQAGRVFTAFAVLAIFIASLGLFGLASFTTNQRTKEIGIRKVMGASIHGIVLLLVKEFVKWVLIANIVAWPIAYYAMNKWLQNFAFRTGLEIWIFVVSAMAALVIAVFTVSYQSIRAAFANPANSLRYE